MSRSSPSCATSANSVTAARKTGGPGEPMRSSGGISGLSRARSASQPVSQSVSLSVSPLRRSDHFTSDFDIARRVDQPSKCTESAFRRSLYNGSTRRSGGGGGGGEAAAGTRMYVGVRSSAVHSSPGHTFRRSKTPANERARRRSAAK